MKGMNRKFHSVGASILNVPADSSTDITSVTTSTTLSGATNAQLPTALAVKTYVDTTATGLSFKNVVVCATTANGTLATAYANGQTVDGVTLATGDRILIKNQTDAKENGIYTVNATGAPTRATDFDSGSEVAGAVVSVKEGTTNADSAWICTGDTIVVGTDNIPFAIFGGIKAGNGLTATADVFAIDTSITADLSTSQTFTNKILTSPTLTTPLIDDTDAGLTITSADQTDASATATVPNLGGAADDFVMEDVAQTLTNKTLTTPTIGDFTNAGHTHADAAGGGQLTSPLINEAVALAATSTTIDGAVAASHTQNTDTGTTATTFTVDSDATAGKIAVTVVGGGTDNTLTLSNQVLSGDVTITLPNATGTLATLAGAEALTNKTNVSVTSTSSAYNNSALNVGKYGTAIADTLVDDNILVSFVNSSGVNKTVADTSSMTLYVGNSTTAAVTNNKMQGVLSSLNVGHNVFDGYAGQFHTAVSDDCGTQNANAHVTGVSAKFSVGTGKTLATGWGTAGLFIVEGAGAVTQMCHVISGVVESGTTAAQSIFHAYSDATINAAISTSGVSNMTNFIDFDAVGGCVTTDTGSPAGTTTHKIKIDINGTAGYIPVYADY